MKFAIPEPNPNPTSFPIQPLYGLDSEQARAMHQRMRWELTDAEYYVFVFKPVHKKRPRRFLPPPLKAVPGSPLVAVFIQQLTVNGAKGNQSLNHGYHELIIGGLATYKGRMGMYPFAIFLETDIGAMLGRESFGTAKKVGQFDYHRSSEAFTWKVSRRGIPLVEAGGKFVGDEVDPENVLKVVGLPSFHLQQLVGPLHSGEPHGYPPRLMEMRPGIEHIRSVRTCDEVHMVFHESPFDPICLLQPQEITAVSYLNADTCIAATGALEQLDPEAVMPFLFSKYDPF